ncbi:PKD-like family lipoprotein [Odoribacter sp. AF15-53]|uniref:PKD-like family lipoprotein n=1 Tax=Odoribacter sp. AF15-53 TaxID=2292236 RepID=UPI001313EF71|nr:PKD-like family lipoprotein [Odoribacter sp. AF15-53]
MKLKNILIGLGLLALFQGTQSCIDDRGNYDYMDKDVLLPVTISGFEDTTVVIRSTLNITPVLENMDDESRYIHLWYAAPSMTAGFAPQRDTLSLKKELSFDVTYESGTYNLVYELRDPKLDIYVRKQVLMTVQSDVSTGWYVMKEENGETDIDYIAMDGDKIENLITSFGQQRLKGKPIKMVYQSSRYTPSVQNPDGTTTNLVNKKAFHVFSDQDIKIFNADNMDLFYNYEDYFYEVPEKCQPQNCGIISTDFYAINAGKVYSIYGMSSNSGMLGFAKPGMYEVHPDMVMSYYGVMLFDKTTSTFYNTSSSGSSMNLFSEDANGGISPTNMDVDMIHMLPRYESVPSTAFAVMRNKNRDECYVFDISYSMSDYPFVDIDTIPVHCEMPDAQVMGTSLYASCIYYAKKESDGDVLKVYKNVKIDNRESELKRFPGEEIVYIVNLTSSYNTPEDEKFNHLVVLTNSDSGWKLYRFNVIGQTPEIEPEPVVVYSGTGKAGYVMLRN